MKKAEKNIEQNKSGKPEESMGKIMDYYFRQLEITNSWIVHADNKVSVLSAMSSLITAVVAIFTKSLWLNPSLDLEVNKTCFMLARFFILASLVLFAGVLIKCALTVKPNLVGNEEKGISFSLFYKDIAAMTKEEFVSLAKEADSETFLNELLSEVYYNSNVCNVKMKQLKCVMCFFICAIVSLAATGIFYCMALNV